MTCSTLWLCITQGKRSKPPYLMLLVLVPLLLELVMLLLSQVQLAPEAPLLLALLLELLLGLSMHARLPKVSNSIESSFKGVPLCAMCVR